METCATPQPVQADDVKWIVNDNGELGVMIRGRAFFLYKGESLEYEDAVHDDGTPMLYRMVGKREFGECCHPVSFYREGYKRPDRYLEPLTYVPGLSHGKPEDGDWKRLPSPKPRSLRYALAALLEAVEERRDQCGIESATIAAARFALDNEGNV